MDAYTRIEQALEASLRPISTASPPRLTRALRHAVFPGGARFRPRLCLEVASASGDANPELALTAAVAIELLHCASLVYDDLPCFDDAPLRRGQPTVHVVYGEELAILSGNALIVRAFELLGDSCERWPQLAGPMLGLIARAAGSPYGITAGQAWESEPRINLRAYHRAKTGALFEAAVLAGALAGGGERAGWVGLGDRLGEAYQVADDLRDALGRPDIIGKPVGQDATHGRPSAVDRLGLDGAVGRLRDLLDGAIHQVPDCEGRGELITLLRGWAEHLLPRTQRANASAQVPFIATA
ncbi:MAG: polyprenyl synthetase family protein [Nannocystis sp.]|nr:polyprenyl synthetase family protein [Nannocystis sp.]